MCFSSAGEIKTLRDLKKVLAPLGYDVSQKSRVIDCVRAAAENPRATLSVGPTLGDALIPAMREVAGPFNRHHKWLRDGDWDFAFRSHFDFVVHDGVDGRYPTQPLFALEFDGETTHSTPVQIRRDLAKNRLCAASGLPLVRIDHTFLYKRENLTLIAWLVELWSAHRHEMPELLAQRDRDLAELTDADRGSPWLLGEHPELDVALVFGATHPFPPTRDLARHLAVDYGFSWPYAGARPSDPEFTPWHVSTFCPPTPSLNSGPVDQWTCEANLSGPDGYSRKILRRADVRSSYPLDERDQCDDVDWKDFLKGNLPRLPAGPWIGASGLLGEALSLHNVLNDIRYQIKRRSTRVSDVASP